MNNQEKELRDILKHYVKRQSGGELEFKDDFKRSGIKGCDRISSQQNCDGKDILTIIETQLSSSNDISDSSIIGPCTFDKSDNPSQGNNNIDSNFLKELTISHGKSKSLDYEQVSRTHDPSPTVGQPVSTSVVDQDRDQSVDQDPSVRDATFMPSSYHSLPGPIIHSLTLSSTGDKSNRANQKKSKKSRSWRTIFPLYRKKHSGNIDQIDQLAQQRANESIETKVEVRPLNSSLFDGDKPFKSHKIGEPLQRMKKKKKIPHFIRNMLSPRNYLSKSANWPHKDHCDSNNNEGPRSGANDTRDDHHHRHSHDYVTRIVTTLSLDNDDHHQDNSGGVTSTERYDVMDGVDQGISTVADDVSTRPVDVIISDSGGTRRQSCPDKPCDCYTRRLDLMVRGLNIVIHKGKVQDLRQEMDEYDKETFHFRNCPFNGVSVRPRNDSQSSGGQSRMSLYQPCEYCNNVDDQLHPEISLHLLPRINTLEDNDEINFNDDHLRFFLGVKCYKEFEKGMGQAIGYKCSIRNLAHLHYVTRKIVRHIGDPNNEDNEQIRQIMHYAEQFCCDHYNSHIATHGSLEDFLKNCTRQDID